MKLINCYISSFGKIKDFNYDFSEGLNTILEENGWGKTTFSVFLKAMFYGLDDSKRNVADNERTKYKPWGSNGLFGGSLTFTYANKPFKLERYFGNKSSEDYANLIDLTTGKVSKFNGEPDELGKRIFKIDKEGFLSTTFFSEKDFEIKSNASLTAKFNSSFDEQDTDLYDLAIAKLDKKVKQYKQRGDKGLIPDTKRRIFELREKINADFELGQAIEQIRKDVNVTELEIINLKEKENQLNAQYERAVLNENLKLKKENYDKLLNDKLKLEGQIQNSNKILNENSLSEQEILQVKRTIDDYSKANAQLEVFVNEYQRLKQKNTEDLKNAPKKPYYLPIILGVVGIALLFVNLIVGFSVIALAIASLLFIIFSKNTAKNNTFDEYLISCEKNLTEYTSIVNEYKFALNNFFSKFNVDNNDYTYSLEILKQVTTEKLIATSRLKEIQLEILTLEKSGVKDVVLDFTVDANSLKNNLRLLKEQIAEKNDYLSRRKLILRQREESLLQVSDYESEVSELTDLLEEYNESFDIFSKTMEFLTQADENLRVQYRKPLSDNFNKYLKLLTGKDIKGEVDVDFKITIQENLGNKEYDYYSQGLKNILEICKRLALIDLLFEDEKPFIILDDPFINMDEKNIEGALKLIDELQKEYQIIYLICHNSRSLN